jgi:hypothetical protein
MNEIGLELGTAWEVNYPTLPKCWEGWATRPTLSRARMIAEFKRACR